MREGKEKESGFEGLGLPSLRPDVAHKSIKKTQCTASEPEAKQMPLPWSLKTRLDALSDPLSSHLDPTLRYAYWL